MKKFLLALFSFLLFSLLPFRSFSVGGLALAQTDLDCKAIDVVNIMDADTCQAIKDLFNNSQVDGPWYDQNPNQFAKKVFQKDNADEIFGERYTFAQINWIINSIAAMLNPASGISNPKQLFDFFIAIKKSIAQTQSGQPLAFSDYTRLGPMGLFAGGISALYSNPPASGIQEIKYTASKIFDYTTGTEPAYAQGYGFSGLNNGGAVRALWTASRNMAYLVMTILLIASGFLIMFRVKINPQTVVSLQTMIPKLIITMILVTFSFAIAGLVIDLIYVFIAAFVGMLSLAGNNLLTDSLKTIKILTNGSFGTYALIQAGSSLITILIITIVGTAGFLVLSGGILLSIASFLALWGTIILIILTVFWVILLAKIYIMLIKAYVMLILQICIGPLQIMLDLVPGQQGFGPWIRNIIANASIFVVVPVMFIIQHLLAGDFVNYFIGLNTFTGLGSLNLNLPFLGGKLTGWDLIAKWIISYTILALTPKIADMVRDALKVPPFKYGSAIGEPVQPFTKLVGGGLAGWGKSKGGFIGGTVSTVGEGIASFKTS